MTDVNLGGWMMTQAALFFVTYGLGYSMPWWTVWFPTMIALPIYLLVVVIFTSVGAMLKETKQ